MGEIWRELLGVFRDPMSFGDISTASKIILGITASSAGILLIKTLKSRPRQYKDPPNMVILVNGPRGPSAPSLGPFCVKLEAYLRIMDIPYKTDLSWTPSSKGKVPWMRYNGESVADSTFCIEFLEKRLHKDINRHLTPEQHAIGRAFIKMAEESLYWTMVLCRWVYHDEYFRILVTSPWQYPFVGLIRRMFQARIRKVTWAQGYGRHTPEEVGQIMEEDLRAISDFLGNKEFLFGSEPCEADCAVFGQLSQFVWHMPGMLGEKLVTETFPNLRAYCLRMKERYWKDWSLCVAKSPEAR